MFFTRTPGLLRISLLSAVISLTAACSFGRADGGEGRQTPQFAPTPDPTQTSLPLEGTLQGRPPTPTAVPGLITTPQAIEAQIPVVPTPVQRSLNPGAGCPPSASCPPVMPGWRFNEQSVEDNGLRISAEAVTVVDHRIDIVYSVTRLGSGPEAHRTPSGVSATTTLGTGIQLIGSKLLGTIGRTTLGILSFEYTPITAETTFTLHVDTVIETSLGVETEIDGDWDLDFMQRIRVQRYDGLTGDLPPVEDVYILNSPEDPGVTSERAQNAGSIRGMVLHLLDQRHDQSQTFYFVVDRVNGLRHITWGDYQTIMACHAPVTPDSPWVCD